MSKAMVMCGSRKPVGLDETFMSRSHGWRRIAAGITKWRDPSVRRLCFFFFFLTFYSEIIIDSHAVVRNNTDKSLYPVTPNNDILHSYSSISQLGN